MARTGEITLIQMNDSHAYLELHPEVFRTGNGSSYAMAGGYARVASVINQVRDERQGGVLAFDCGDTLHGTFVAHETKGGALIPILNAMGFDAMTAHREFSQGVDRLKALAEELEYPILASNCYSSENNQRIFPPYEIREVNGLRIGIAGLASPVSTEPPVIENGLRFTNGAELAELVDELRSEERVELVVVISHAGFARDIKCAREIDGINVILSAHSHNQLRHPVVINNTLLIESGSHGSFLGRLDLDVEDGRIKDYNHRLITVDESVEPDQHVLNLVDEALLPYRPDLERVVGQTSTALTRSTMLESTMDNFVTQSLRHVSEAHIGFSSGWRCGVPVLPGTVMFNDLYNITPENPRIKVMEVSGEELRNLLEDNIERIFSSDDETGFNAAFQPFSGARVYLRPETPYPHRIQDLFVGKERVQDNHTYVVAYLHDDGMISQYGSSHSETEVRAIDAMQRYLAADGPVCTDLCGTVELI